MNPDIIKTMQEYVDSAKKKKLSNKEIKERLKDAGFTDEEIKEAFDPNFKPAQGNQPEEKPEKKLEERLEDKKQKKFFNYHKLRTPLLIVSSAIVLFLLIFAVINISSCGEECFVKKVNDCKEGTFTSNIDSIEMQIDVYDDCSYTKTLVGLAATEPQEIKDLFLGKSMICYYDKGNFPEETLSTLTNDLGKCEGELKDNLELVLLLSE